MRNGKLVRNGRILGAAALMAALFLMNKTVSLAEATATVSAESVKIRQEANTTSNVIGSSVRGKTVTIKDGVKDEAGTVWYRVYVNADTLGYVRSDLVKIADGEADVKLIEASAVSGSAGGTAGGASADTTGETAPADAGAGASAAETPMDLQYATISVAAAKVRPDASTSGTPLESLPEGRQVVVSGQSDGADGKVWYYVTYTSDDGTEKSGFVRSDLLKLGEKLPVEPEEPVEEPAEEPVEEPEVTQPVNIDYELTYEADSEGNMTWYLYDHTVGENTSNKYKLEEVLTSSRARNDQAKKQAATIMKQRIVMIVLGVLAAALIIAVVIMAFKLRDAYYEDYEDEEEEDEEEEEERPARRSAREASGRQEADTRSDAGRRSGSAVRNEQGRRADLGQRTDAGRRAGYQTASKTSPQKPARQTLGSQMAESAPKRKTKNFLMDDDEFEFEFLNMDDKDI